MAVRAEITMIEQESIRADFIFRFGDRVINIRPIRDRLVDLPAIARRVWQDLWAGEQANGGRPRAFPVSLMPELVRRNNRWYGNVRAVRTLLSLGVSTFRYTKQSWRRIVEATLDRGPEYHHWVGVISEPAARTRTSLLDTRLQKVLALDATDDCSTASLPWPSSASEHGAHAVLTGCGIDGALERFEQCLETRRSSRKPVRLSRILCYVDAHGTIGPESAGSLCEVSRNTFLTDCNLLIECGLLRRCESAAARHERVWATATGSKR